MHTHTSCFMHTVQGIKGAVHVGREQYMHEGSSTCRKGAVHVGREQYMYEGSSTCMKGAVHV